MANGSRWRVSAVALPASTRMTNGDSRRQRSGLLWAYGGAVSPDEPETCRLPENAVLAETAEALNRAGLWAYVLDREYRVVYMTDELRRSNGGLIEMVRVPLGAHLFGTDFLDAALGWPTWTLDTARRMFAAMGPWVLADAPGGSEQLRESVDPRLLDMIDRLAPTDRAAALAYKTDGSAMRGKVLYDLNVLVERIRDASGRTVGTNVLFTTAVGMSTIGVAAAIGDLGHFGRMQLVARAERRPAAVLFADLEGSSALARRLSTANYFTLIRRLARAADKCVIDAGGLVGRHAGDGAVAFFLVETAGSESAAARACIEASRALGASLPGVAARSGLQVEDVVLRFGLHWGSNLHVGNISTLGRSEVTALGDEVNQAARIEACARGGRTLASKDLVERLATTDAAALGLDPHQITYTSLGELATTTEKARRDAPTIPVCELPPLTGY
ncbi:MAG: guanylate cyclase [Solirubrobacterales bacterium]|nr:guanylate cyclase [Solirubrobacterales bacterium]